MIVQYGQKYVANLYISNFQSGLKVLVNVGYNAKVTPFMEPTTMVNVTKENG